MIPTLIVLGFVALGVAIVAFATRHGPARPGAPHQEPDTASGELPVADAANTDPFAHAPLPQTVIEPFKETERLS
jgi:hypothetical protein